MPPSRRSWASTRRPAPCQPANEIARFERVGALYDCEWGAVYASALAEYAAPAHRATITARIEARLDRARSGAGYHCPNPIPERR